MYFLCCYVFPVLLYILFFSKRKKDCIASTTKKRAGVTYHHLSSTKFHASVSLQDTAR